MPAAPDSDHVIPFCLVHVPITFLQPLSSVPLPIGNPVPPSQDTIYQITDEASLTVLNLRRIGTQRSDYKNPIEPSSSAGKRITASLTGAVEVGDLTGRLSLAERTWNPRQDAVTMAASSDAQKVFGHVLSKRFCDKP